MLVNWIVPEPDHKLRLTLDQIDVNELGFEDIAWICSSVMKQYRDEFNALDGDGIVDDDAAYGKTNGNGQIIWFISYSEALNPGDGDNPETYEDFTSTVTLQLLDPLQTASDGVDILLIKYEINDND